VAAAALLAVLAGFGASCGDGDSNDADDQGPPVTPTTIGEAGTGNPESALGKKVNEARIPYQLADGTRIGAADAKVVIDMYEDFGCPHCLDFTANHEPELMAQYVATGQVALVYRFWPLRQATVGPALAGYCAAEQDAFWQYHRLLFVAQAEANAKTGPDLAEAFGLESLKAFATETGIDVAKFETCLNSDAAINELTADTRKATELSLPGTPSFVIDGKMIEAPDSIAEWRKLLDGLLR